MPLIAQENLGLRTTEPLTLDSEAEDPEDIKRWDIRVGVLGAYGPDYEGANQYELDVIPYARVSWRERIVFRGRSLEANVYRRYGIRFGPMVQTRGGRNDDESELDGLGEIDRSFELGGFARYVNGPLRARVNILHDVAAAHSGLVINMNGGVQIPLQNPWFSLRVGATWADDSYMQSFYGVNARQSLASGLSRFGADAGIKDVRVSLGTRVPLTEHISALVSVGYKRLTGDAADSPIVRQRGNADQGFIALGAVYRF